jgi:phosphatidylserine decarboxylase
LWQADIKIIGSERMAHRHIVALEGWPFIVPGIILSVITAMYSLKWCLPFVILTLFLLWFFRNPQRHIDPSPGLIVAPADGKVMSVKKVKEHTYIGAETIQVRIFLNIFNVHVNRVPIQAKVDWVHRTGGMHLPAYKCEAAARNAQNYVGLITDWGKVLVVQITGLVARRIVCWVAPGDEVNTGDRFGLIRFGSCTELYLPCTAEVMVQPGDKLKGGVSVIGRFYS